MEFGVRSMMYSVRLLRLGQDPVVTVSVAVVIVLELR